MYYDTRNKTFGHAPAGIARELSASFGAATLQVGPYRYYEPAPEPAYDAATQRIEPSDVITQRAGKPWLRGWTVIDRPPEEIAAEQQERMRQQERARGADLLAQVQGHPLYVGLKNATLQEIIDDVDAQFGGLSDEQRDRLKLVFIVCQAVVKERA